VPSHGGGRDGRSPPPLEDYGLIGDCHGAALVSCSGAIDWCCIPRFDSGSCFGRLLGWERGGHCTIAPVGLDPARTTREYLGDSLVLATTLHGDGGELLLVDCLTMCRDDVRDPRRQLLRIVEARRGRVELDVHVVPRFDYGGVRPWLRREGQRLTSALGGDDALLIACDRELEATGEHELRARAVLDPQDRLRLSLAYVPPELLDEEVPRAPTSEQLDACLEQTLAWWREWSQRVSFRGRDAPGVMRSALTLEALTYAPTGAIVAAPTTSLPERIGGDRNWDYRYSWVRDSSFSSRSLAELGCEREADRFRQFIERSAAGHAEDLKILYGIGGERRIGEQQLELDGYAGSRPVRVGNEASGQLQLDTFGELVNLSWRWHRRGHSPDDDHWRFLVSLVDRAAELWEQPDCGLWEWRDEPRHFVHSKALCWAAFDRALRLAEECMRRAPTRRWSAARDAARDAIETRGYDEPRGIFVQAFDRPELDAALLLLPTVEFVAWDDERMVRTVAAIRAELADDDGLLLWRYRSDSEPEGAFLACSFWLVECLARQGDVTGARAVFDRTSAAANDLGLFAEEHDPATGAALGNFPQGLTHLAHVTAALALAEAGG
jgi:GH15 family glucan-1,4-alpha-glucosidase